MNRDEIKRLQVRIGYCSTVALKKSGGGFRYSAMATDGRVHDYQFENIRNVAHLESEISNWCSAVWSLKDFICMEAKASGKPKTWWEGIVKSSVDLQLTADLANQDKHGSDLRSRWTQSKPTIGKPSCGIPSESLKEISFFATAVKADVDNSELVKFDIPVLDKEGRRIGNALDILSRAVDAWEVALRELGVAQSEDESGAGGESHV